MAKKRKPLRKSSSKSVTESPQLIVGDACNTIVAEQESDKTTVKKRKTGAKTPADEVAEKGKDQIGDDSEEDSDDSEGDIDIEAVTGTSPDYTFDFMDPSPAFVESVTTLLKVWIANPTKSYELAEQITQQQEIGTMIVCEGDVEVFAFATVLPLITCGRGPLGPFIDSFVTELAELRSSEAEKMRECVQAPAKMAHTGIYFHRKFSNLPLPLIEPLHKNLIEDLEWARENGCGEKSDSAVPGNFEIDSVLCLTSFANDPQRNHDTKRGKAIEVTGSSSIMFDYFEDEVLVQQSTCSVLFSHTFFKRPIVVSLLEASKLRTCLKDIQKMTT